jgi:hypothetical protein
MNANLEIDGFDDVQISSGLLGIPRTNQKQKPNLEMSGPSISYSQISNKT